MGVVCQGGGGVGVVYNENVEIGHPLIFNQLCLKLAKATQN